MMDTSHPAPVACSQCFTDQGLQLDAEKIGQVLPGTCPNCGAAGFRKLSLADIKELAHRFFVWGSLWRARYGAAPMIQFNEHQKTSIDVAPWLSSDVQLFERLLGVGFFQYGPRLWMVGEVEPLKDLQKKRGRQVVIERILTEYPARTLSSDARFFRIRVNPHVPSSFEQYDSPPPDFAGRGRLDSSGKPVLYGSSDLEVCVHECRVSAEDDVYVATLAAKKPLRLLDLSVLLKDENVTEFESLDMAVHMLFLAGKHSYPITRAIADAARSVGFDGIVYPSYFSLLRLGQMPFQTVYGISCRRIPEFQKHEEAKSIPNLALFGRPVAEGKIEVTCINKLILARVAYDFHFGPTRA